MTPATAAEITALADREIRECLAPGNPKSFFLYAGAGSGKTRALVGALKWIRDHRRNTLYGEGRRLGVITYTNAATEEIKRRIEFDPFVAVSTIHAFAWDLIAGFDNEIRQWLRGTLEQDIIELTEQHRKGRAGTKAAVARVLAMQAKSERQASLDSVRRFVYSPSGDNTGIDSLNHAEVIGMSAEFLRSRRTLQQILINRFPILFVDESQDTNRYFMDALLELQTVHRASFCLGLFGDTMQRIYADGKVDLAGAIPSDWAKPAKLVNFRCPQRVLRLINHIRSQDDGQIQIAPPDSSREGYARVFIAASDETDRLISESRVADRMAEITGVPSWPKICKRFILEHHMAAKRLGFSELFEPLYSVDGYKTPLLEGTLTELNLLTVQALQILDALRENDHFRLAAVMRMYSPILDPRALKGPVQQFETLDEARRATEEFHRCFEGGTNPIVGDVLRVVKTTSLLEIPPILLAALKAYERNSTSDEGVAQSGEEMMTAWNSVLRVPFSQVERYADYIGGSSPFGTHQGVKGLEFLHVMVIIDDSGSRGFMFSYDKLFGLKPKSESDRKNEAGGIETTIDRTRRLLYVTCSRAQESLAIVAYSPNPSQLKRFLVSEGWFNEGEVELVT